MSKIRYYIASFRLRTLPLSLSGIFLGSMLAAANGCFVWLTFGLAVLTTLCLQILSNLANEWGDLQKGTDNEQRLGPIRSIQSGALSMTDFKRLMGLFFLFSLVSGSFLVYVSFDALFSKDGLIMLGLGAVAVVAAIKYTVGKHAYGYKGLGDLFVFLFFGLLSAAGMYFLLVHRLDPFVFLPASSVGLLSVGVLNMNNIRDMENDRQCGKRTLPVLLGEKRAKIYHFILILGAFLCMSIYVWGPQEKLISYLFLLTLPLFFLHLRNVVRAKGRELDPQLRFLSLTTLLFALLAGLGQLL